MHDAQRRAARIAVATDGIGLQGHLHVEFVGRMFKLSRISARSGALPAGDGVSSNSDLVPTQTALFLFFFSLLSVHFFSCVPSLLFIFACLFFVCRS